MSSADCGLIVFLRLPEKGKVKTRLAKSLGDDEALSIYNELSEASIFLAARSRLPCYLFYEGGLPLEESRHKTFKYLPQIPGADLGKKILASINAVLQWHSMVIIIGSDCPYLTVADLEEATLKLESFDFVIGPSEDGGYYLLGCKEVLPSLFDDIAWSTPFVLEETLLRLRTLRKKVHLLRPLNDIDNVEDWYRYRKRNA